jgi:hypothetical protein
VQLNTLKNNSLLKCNYIGEQEGDTSPVWGSGSSEKGEEVGKVCGRVNIVQILSTHECDETILGMVGRGIKENDAGSEFKYDISDMLQELWQIPRHTLSTTIKNIIYTNFSESFNFVFYFDSHIVLKHLMIINICAVLCVRLSWRHAF